MQCLSVSNIESTIVKKFSSIAEKKCGWTDLALSAIFFATIENKTLIVPVLTCSSWVVYQLFGENRRDFDLEKKFHTYRKVNALISEKKEVLVKKRIDLNNLKKVEENLAKEIKEILLRKDDKINEFFASEIGGNLLKFGLQGIGSVGSWGLKKLSSAYSFFGDDKTASELKKGAKECDNLRSLGHKLPFIDWLISSTFSIGNRFSSVEVSWLDFLALSALNNLLFSSTYSKTRLLSAMFFLSLGTASKTVQLLKPPANIERAYTKYTQAEWQMNLQMDIIGILNKFGLENSKTQEVAFKQYENYRNSFNDFSNTLGIKIF